MSYYWRLEDLHYQREEALSGDLYGPPQLYNFHQYAKIEFIPIIYRFVQTKSEDQDRCWDLNNIALPPTPYHWLVSKLKMTTLNPL